MSAVSGAAPDASIDDNDRPRIDVAAMPRVLRRIIVMTLRADPWQVAGAMFCSLGAAVAGLTAPRLFGHAIDQAQAMLKAAQHARRLHLPVAAQSLLQTRSAHALLVAAGLIVLANSLQGLLTGLSGYQGERVSQRLAYRLRLAYFAQLQRLSFSFHDRIHSGDLITRGMIDLEGARTFVQNGMMSALTLLLLLAVATWLMVSADPLMALLALAFAPFSIVTLSRVGFLLRLAWMRVQIMMSVLTLTMEENLQGVRVVRAFAARAFEMAKFDEASREALAQAYQRILLRMRAIRTTSLAFYASMALVLWFGGHKVAAGTMTAGRLIEFVFYMQILQDPVRQVIIIVISAARATTCGARLFEILDLQPQIADRPGAKPLAPGDGVLAFEHVDFAYDPGRPVLRDVSFAVGPGRTLGVVGPPGGGKSTLANLIPRFYDVESGRITIGGHDIRDVQLASLRDYVGLVQQDAFLFDATVTNNVAYADPWAEAPRITDATRTAQLHNYISQLPDAYDARVGERGVALSGGQRQRMSIARGVLPGPGIMIFDDSTAAIDAVTERRVREALAKATVAKATIIIAHRLSSLMHADEILVLDEGRIVERGTHAQLLALGGDYFDLHQQQTRTDQGLSIADAKIRRTDPETAP
jgi:ATP-binding cassette subfamily B multidrug efflux pump